MQIRDHSRGVKRKYLRKRYLKSRTRIVAMVLTGNVAHGTRIGRRLIADSFCNGSLKAIIRLRIAVAKAFVLVTIVAGGHCIRTLTRGFDSILKFLTGSRLWKGSLGAGSG